MISIFLAISIIIYLFIYLKANIAILKIIFVLIEFQITIFIKKWCG